MTKTDKINRDLWISLIVTLLIPGSVGIWFFVIPAMDSSISYLSPGRSAVVVKDSRRPRTYFGIPVKLVSPDGMHSAGSLLEGTSVTVGEDTASGTNSDGDRTVKVMVESGANRGMGAQIERWNLRPK